ncbi:MAG: hypothetical protein OEZ01_10260 [Candidatus Heimdallarchaeota archaeon]|nr:hypothetical protein [Candidatus Heimdallarchaeota archaeon]MDH5646382.1 hypothetical protein [Candidatus Heimdallarchaeota archaeon]
MVLHEGIDFFSFIPAIGAAALSVLNWLKLRKGADLRPYRILNYAIWGLKKDSNLTKWLWIPIIVNNKGMQDGYITNVNLEIVSDGASKPIKSHRRVELLDFTPAQLKNMNLNQFKSGGLKVFNPIYPIIIPSQDGKSFIMECSDLENIIPLDKEVNMRVELTFNDDLTSKIEFPYKLTSQGFEKSLDGIIWLDVN